MSVIKIVSTSSIHLDLKIILYFGNGVKDVWLVPSILMWLLFNILFIKVSSPVHCIPICFWLYFPLQRWIVAFFIFSWAMIGFGLYYVIIYYILSGIWLDGWFSKFIIIWLCLNSILIKVILRLGMFYLIYQ